MDITILGIDIAKNVFQLHGVNKAGKVVYKKRLRREKLMEHVSQLPKCTIAMETCGSLNYWARKLEAQGHQ